MESLIPVPNLVPTCIDADEKTTLPTLPLTCKLANSRLSGS
jgi:hypothetical protein